MTLRTEKANTEKKMDVYKETGFQKAKRIHSYFNVIVIIFCCFYIPIKIVTDSVSNMLLKIASLFKMSVSSGIGEDIDPSNPIDFVDQINNILEWLSLIL